MSRQVDWSGLEHRVRVTRERVLELDRLQDAPPLKAVLDFTMILASACNDDPPLKAILKDSGAITELRNRAAELRATGAPAEKE
jgi:hypothetical protein